MIVEVFDIEGMTCSACSGKVEKTVSKLQGMYAVRVNLLTNSMHVRFDNSVLAVDEIVSVIEHAGYKARPRKSTVTAEYVAPEKSKKSRNNLSLEHVTMKKRWQWSLCFLIPLMYIAMGEMMHLPVPIWIQGHENAMVFVLLQFMFTLPIYLINKSYFSRGFNSLLKGSPNMESLIAVGASAAIIYGVFAMFRIAFALSHNDEALLMHYAHQLYFESGATILTLITLGKYFEARSKSKTSEAITKLMDLSPVTALVLRNGDELELPVEQVLKGDSVVLKSGARVPVDGIIISGDATLDESALSGESIPVFREVGDKVMAGTINKSGYIIFRAEQVGENTTIAQIIRLVEEAASSKAPISHLADRISALFVPVVIVIAILASAIWLLMGHSFEFALSIGISVLVISCPCALGLATPVAVMVGTGRAATQGMLVKSAENFEIAAGINTVVFDKTGTLTEGKPVVVKIVANRFFSEDKLLAIAASIERLSEHPLAGAVLDEATFRELQLDEALNYRSEPGLGICAEINKRPYYVGNMKLIEKFQIKFNRFLPVAESMITEGITPLFVANTTEVLGVIGVSDVLKSDSEHLIRQLRLMRIKTVMLSGDHEIAANAIGQKIGIDRVVAGLLPSQKSEEIALLKASGARVAMVGDGINDAPALMRADLGIAIGAGTDIAIESAGVVLMSHQLSGILRFLQLSRDVMRNIRQNLFWAFFYNVLGIPLAAGVFYPFFGWTLSPMFAAAAMSISSITVVMNALRLKRAGVIAQQVY